MGVEKKSSVIRAVSICRRFPFQDKTQDLSLNMSLLCPLTQCPRLLPRNLASLMILRRRGLSDQMISGAGEIHSQHGREEVKIEHEVEVTEDPVARVIVPRWAKDTMRPPVAKDSWASWALVAGAKKNQGFML